MKKWGKVAPPFRKAEFDIIFGEGVSKASCMIDSGIECGVLNRSGAWFSYGETRLGQGKDAAKAFLNEHPAVLREVEERIRAEFNLSGATTEKPSVPTPTEEETE